MNQHFECVKAITETMSVEHLVSTLTDGSDLKFASPVYDELCHELVELGLNLAFVVFTSREHSSCSRTLHDGNEPCPVLVVYLKHVADFQQTQIDPLRGNWGDEWSQTQDVRNTLNAVLKRHACENNDISEQTLIFVDTLEEIAFREIGRECKAAVQQLVCDESPGVTVSRVFWNGHQYDVIMSSPAEYKRVRRGVKTKVAKKIPELLAAADKQGYCQNYEATVEFGFLGMNLFHLTRDDV